MADCRAIPLSSIESTVFISHSDLMYSTGELRFIYKAVVVRVDAIIRHARPFKRVPLRR